MKLKAFFAVLVSGLVATPLAAETARDHIWMVGSSTVYPFATAAAERFSKQHSEFRVPVVESTGTGGGIKLFCESVDGKSPDIANASRAMKASELEQCQKSGVKNIIELKIGLDGIVIANAASDQHYNLTKKQIFLALAKQVPVNGQLVANPYKNWNEIDSSLPAHAIEVYGPPPTSGTRDAFVEMVMHKGCDAFPEFAKVYADAKVREKACGVLREDNVYQDAGENDNLLVQKLVANPKALGIFGYSFLEENADKVQGSTIEGVNPTFENVSAGKYPISRPLFLYVKGEHLKTVPGIKEFMKELAQENMLGEDGFLTGKGLIPLPAAEREKLRKTVAAVK